MHTQYFVYITIFLFNFVKCNPVIEEEGQVGEIRDLVLEHVINQANIPITFHLEKPTNIFIGRVAELSELKWAHIDKKIVVINGPRGVGKSELSRKYSSEFKHDNTSSIIWIDSESHESLITSFKDLAVIVGIKIESKSVTTLIREVITHFNNRKTLFIFDNAADDNVIVNNLPTFIGKSSFIYVIITSRNENWGEKFKLLPLTHFTKEEAKEYIENTLKKGVDLTVDEMHIDRFTELHEYLPLALSEAVSYIVKQNILYQKRVYTIADYIRHFENNELTTQQTVVYVTQPPMTDEAIEDVVSNKIKEETKRVGDQITNEAKRFGNRVSNEAKRAEKKVRKWFGK